MQKLCIKSSEFDFLKKNHKILKYSHTKIDGKTCLSCVLEDKITVWYNGKLHIYGEIILVNRTWLSRRLKRLKQFPVSVHIIDKNSIRNNSLKNAFNIAWGTLEKCNYSVDHT